jgi:uncharacterized protein HemX
MPADGVTEPSAPGAPAATPSAASAGASGAPSAGAALPPAGAVAAPALTGPTLTAPQHLPTGSSMLPRMFLLLLALVCAIEAIALVLLWQKLDFVQTESARRLQLAEALAAEARGQARQAVDEVRQAQTRLALAEAKLQDYSAQRAAIDKLLADSATREQSRLLAEFEQLLTLAEQESQIAASPVSLLTALGLLQARAELAPPAARDRLKRALTRDVELLRAADIPDRAQWLARFDELARVIEELPLAAEVRPPAADDEASRLSRRAADASGDPWGRRLAEARGWLAMFFAPLLDWFEVRRIDRPAALLASPEQQWFLRENLKLQVQSARSSLLARQSDAYARSMARLAAALADYADPRDARVRQAQALVAQLRGLKVAAELPRARETRAVLLQLGLR